MAVNIAQPNQIQAVSKTTTIIRFEGHSTALKLYVLSAKLKRVFIWTFTLVSSNIFFFLLKTMNILTSILNKATFALKEGHTMDGVITSYTCPQALPLSSRNGKAFHNLML